ncbi:MAG: hypothetical protein ACM3NF_12275 [Gemmatimonadota bacterium]
MKSEKKIPWRKMAAAAALLVIFAAVLFAIPPERLAWQGPYVMGTLLLPKPSAAPYVRPEMLKDSADSAFSLLAFLSVAGILALAARKLPVLPQGRRMGPPDRGLKLPAKDKITIMYIL